MDKIIVCKGPGMTFVCLFPVQSYTNVVCCVSLQLLLNLQVPDVTWQISEGRRRGSKFNVRVVKS